MGNPLIVLGDADVHNLLLNLTRPEILSFQSALHASLRSVSSIGPEAQYQPTPGVVNRSNGQKVLFRPFTSPDSVGTKIIVDPAPVEIETDGVKVTTKSGLHGVLMICDETGIPRGLVNAEEVTGFRTSLSALIPFVWRSVVKNVVVFGSGKQALWHLRLALGLRGDEIESITVVVRSKGKGQELLNQVKKENAQLWKSAAVMETVLELGDEDKTKVEEVLGTADAIFCTVPSTNVLFTLDAVLGRGARKTNPLITAIGSWQPQMIELDPAIVRHAVHPTEGTENSSHAFLVDDLHDVVGKTGEGIQSGVKAEDALEIGRVFEDDKVLSEEVKKDGFVVYKSVGVGITDLVSGTKILGLAGEKKLGTQVNNF